MRIAHVCLAAFYIDGFGYQENILPRVHKAQGHDVMVIASTENYRGPERVYDDPRTYVNEDGITVKRLAYASWVPKRLAPKLRAYEDVTASLEAFRPDLIFTHDTQFWDLRKVARYAQAHDIPLVADCHTDYVNSARGFASKHLLHGLLYRWIVRTSDYAIARHWATLPARASFLQEMYGIDPAKIEILPFGVEDTGLDPAQRATLRADIRRDLGIGENDVVFVTGGKLDKRKNIHKLATRFSHLKNEGKLGNAHLIIFGKPDEETARLLDEVPRCDAIHRTGWAEAKDISGLLLSGDVAFFPGTHSVLWEQAIGLGLPVVIHRWPGIDHLDKGGNTITIERADDETLDGLLVTLSDPHNRTLEGLADAARRVGPAHFAYTSIADRAVREWMPDSAAKV